MEKVENDIETTQSYFCGECGGSDISFAALVRWNGANQRFLFEGKILVGGDHRCQSCSGGDIRVKIETFYSEAL